jgi:hypothetical protein
MAKVGSRIELGRFYTSFFEAAGARRVFARAFHDTQAYLGGLGTGGAGVGNRLLLKFITIKMKAWRIQTNRSVLPNGS